MIRIIRNTSFKKMNIIHSQKTTIAVENSASRKDASASNRPFSGANRFSGRVTTKIAHPPELMYQCRQVGEEKTSWLPWVKILVNKKGIMSQHFFGGGKRSTKHLLKAPPRVRTFYQMKLKKGCPEILFDFLAMVNSPFQRLSDLQRSGIKRSRRLNHLVVGGSQFTLFLTIRFPVQNQES